MAAPQLLTAPIILLKEGTDSSRGRSQIISNINACQAIVEILKTTLGPRGMDKLIYDENRVTISNDGATIVELLNVVHPAARILVDIAQAQDDEVGDGTTSVVLLAGEFLSEAKAFIEEGMAPQVIIRGYQAACKAAIMRLEDVRVSLADKDGAERRLLLERCALTTLNSKLLAGYKEMFAKMVVDAVMLLDDALDKNLIGVKKVSGGSIKDSMLIDGVAFKKTFSYAGFEQQPKKFENPKILLLSLELELKAEKENAEVRVTNPADYQAIVDAEWKIIYSKLDQIIETGAQVVLSRLPIGDLATQYFADHNVFCAGRVDESDLKRTARATGAAVQSTVNRITPDVLGSCGIFEEVQVGSERYNIFRNCPLAKSATLILRGGATQFIDEAERSLNDAIMIVRRAVKTNSVVGGGGAIEMELSRHLRQWSRTISGKQQLLVNSYAKALECIPKTLAYNSGLDQTNILNLLRQKHHEGKPENRWYGVNCMEGGICNTFEGFVWEPTLVKLHAIQAATQAACVILSVDETIRNAKSNPEPRMPAGRGRGMRPGMGMKAV